MHVTSVGVGKLSARRLFVVVIIWSQKNKRWLLGRHPPTLSINWKRYRTPLQFRTRERTFFFHVVFLISIIIPCRINRWLQCNIKSLILSYRTHRSKWKTKSIQESNWSIRNQKSEIRNKYICFFYIAKNWKPNTFT
jgi:hypothetical protein